MEIVKIKLNTNLLQNLVGINDTNLKLFKTYLGVDVSIYKDSIISDCDDYNKSLLLDIFNVLIKLVENNIHISTRDVIYIINLAKINKLDNIEELYLKRKKILISQYGNSIYPKTFNQQKYIRSLEKNTLVFATGPAGTGKTYLAVAYATNLFKKNLIKKIVITRPVVEAGESLGFLPGDLKEKVDPYLVPIYDCLYEMLGKEQTDILIEKNIIEIAPLAYMRGRTLENSFIILDEAQNTTTQQMKMFLTRLGFNSKMVVTGDSSQIDLKYNVKSGLIDAISRLQNIDDICIIKLDKIDVIRNPIVQKIIERYEDCEN